MTTPIIETAKAIIEHPKTPVVVLTLTGLEKIWVNWGSWVVDASYSIASLVLVLYLIRRQVVIHKKEKDK